MRRRFILAGITGIITLFLGQTGNVYAHERWFVNEEVHTGAGFPFDLTIGLVLASAVALVAVAFAVEWVGRTEKWRLLAQKTERLLPKGAEWRVLAVLVGVMLIANAMTGVFLAPNLVPDEGFMLVSRIAQVVIGLVLLSQVFFSVGGVLILAALPLAFFLFPADLLVDYVFEYLFLGLTFAFVGISACPDQLACRLAKGGRQRYADLALTTARAGTGVTFAVLALHNKLLDPNMALIFLDKYPLNFMPLIGFADFSNLHFVFATGIVEVAVGLLLITGIATRFIGAVVTGILFTTLFVLGPMELIGHLPIMGLAILFTYRGAGPHRLVLPGWKKPRAAVQLVEQVYPVNAVKQ